MTQLMPTDIRQVISVVMDPEIGINIVDLGLVYGVDVNPDGNVYILMTFTSPTCPFSDQIISQITELVENIDDVVSVEIEITFDPPWSQSLMSEEAQLQSGLL